MSEHVPTTDEIREDYAHMIAPHTTWGEDGFDAWLDRERAEARREGQAEAWDEGHDAATDEAPDGVWPDAWIDTHNPYRQEADQ